MAGEVTPTDAMGSLAVSADQDSNSETDQLSKNNAGGNGDIDSLTTAERTAQLTTILDQIFQDYSNLKIETIQLDKLKTLINQGVDVNAEREKGVPLIRMVQGALKCLESVSDPDGMIINPFMEVICLLISHGADLNAQNTTGWTPLVLAIMHRGIPSNRVEELEAFIKLLIGNGASLESPQGRETWSATTPLIEASRSMRYSVVKLLLSQKVDVNAQVNGVTAVSVAINPGYDIYPVRGDRVISALLEHGGKLRGKDWEILSRAISNCPGIVEYLLAYIYGEAKPEHHPNDNRQIGENMVDNPGLEEDYKRFMETLDRLVAMDMAYAGSPARSRTLCSNCQAFETNAHYRKWHLHSRSQKQLRLAVSQNCSMCQLIKDCLPGPVKEVQLCYFSVLPQVDPASKDYYERILVRGQKSRFLKNEDFVFGELSLATVDDETASTVHHATGFQDVSTDSASSFQIVAHWLRTCLTRHDSCHFDRNPLLPTRVIDVGPSDGSKDPKLFITKGQRGIYVSLSYCWGDVPNVRTQIETLDAFQKCIPLNIIPKTIREAIIVTRRLGIRYLWVDTLCIVQDSTDDWLREAKGISSVYQDSVLTIAASAADSLNSEGGLFRPRNRLRTRPFQFAPNIAPFDNPKRVFVFGDRRESRDALRCESRLDTRGWVLQEQLLSSRTLNYSSQELYWECSALNASESYPAGIPREYDANFERQRFAELKMNLRGSGVGLDKERMHMLWQDMVSLYSKRKLSIETDRLVALAGAASQAAKIFEDKFLAGLWVKRLWRDLLWRVEGDVNSPNFLCVRQTEFKVPSWSWASIKGPITFEDAWGTNRMKLYPCIQILNYDEKMDIKANEVSGYVVVRGIVLSQLPLSLTQAVTPDLTDKSNYPSDLANQARYWKPDTSGIPYQDVQYLIVAACRGHAVCLGIKLDQMHKGEYRRVGLAYARSIGWSNHLVLPTEVQSQVITLI